MRRMVWVMVVAAACGKDKAPMDGARLFAAACARCHGPEGRGGVPAAPNAPVPRNFVDPAFQAARTDADLRRTILEGKGTGMPPFKAALAPDEIDALVAHLRTFDPRRQ